MLYLPRDYRSLYVQLPVFPRTQGLETGSISDLMDRMRGSLSQYNTLVRVHSLDPEPEKFSQQNVTFPVNVADATLAKQADGKPYVC
jgi:hypothetical protein